MMTSQTILELTQQGKLAKQVLEEVISHGVSEFCLCPAGRNAPLVYPLVNSPQANIYYWSEERSAAFFALGRIKATGKPVAVVTTSGTAAAEILPAAMEAYYTGLPLVIITADRPRRFRGTGAPQSAEQVGLYSYYAQMFDVEEKELLKLDQWDKKGPIHLNICLEEPIDSECQKIFLDTCQIVPHENSDTFTPDERYLDFLKKVHFPLVVIGGLRSSQTEAAVQFLLHLQAPVYLEGISGIREDPRLESLSVTRMEKIWSFSADHGYPIDGILRIGTIPTIRLWRDIEHKNGVLPVCSISDLPFSGLSCADVITTPLIPFFDWAKTIHSRRPPFTKWKEADRKAQETLLKLFQEEPLAEASLIHQLSQKIPRHSKVYLGNSLPIREWDLAATYDPKGYKMACNRGVNGIDGQFSTFLGFSSSEQENWAILGDLTLLYDLIAPWIMAQLSPISANLVIINNGGAGIFKKMFAHPAFINTHSLSFEPVAKFWNWKYEQWYSIPNEIGPSHGGRIIELIPDLEATERFSKKVI